MVDERNKVLAIIKEQPQTGEIKASVLTKATTVGKKIFKNAVMSRLTGIDPYFGDNDLSTLKNNSIENCMKCDLVTLYFSATQDFIDGLEKLNALLASEKKRWIVCQVNWFYKKLVTTFSESYPEQTDYGIYYPALFYATEIFDQGSLNKFSALADRGCSINMTIPPFEEITKIYKKRFQSENQKTPICVEGTTGST